MEACAEGWEKKGDHCYLWSDDKKNWTAAESFCREEGGHLATVNTNATKEFVLEGLASKNLGSSNVRTWIGGNDIEEEGVWKWTDCTNWDADFWAPGEPDNLGNQNCLTQIQRWDNLPYPMLDDYGCSGEIEFLCSKEICSSKGKISCSIWICLSSPRTGPSGLRAESGRSVTGRRCPHSGWGEDFLARQTGFFLRKLA